MLNLDLDIRDLYHAKSSILRPLACAIDDESGPFAGSDVSEESGADEDRCPSATASQILCSFVIYCDLFHHTIDAAYGQLPVGVKPLSDTMRHRWLQYCMPHQLNSSIIETEELSQRSDLWTGSTQTWGFLRLQVSIPPDHFIRKSPSRAGGGLPDK